MVSPNSNLVHTRPKSAEAASRNTLRPTSAKSGRVTVIGMPESKMASRPQSATSRSATKQDSTALAKASSRPASASTRATILQGGRTAPRPTSAPGTPGPRPTSGQGTLSAQFGMVSMGPQKSTRPSSAPLAGSSRMSLIPGTERLGNKRPVSASAAVEDDLGGRDGKRRPESAPPKTRTEKVGPRNVSTGDTTILWNTAAPPNDVSAFLLKKRRQKLTNEELKEIVVTTGDSYQEVMGWFEVFEFYCDPVVDPVLPSMPGVNQFRGRRNSQASMFEIPQSEQNFSDDANKQAELQANAASPTSKSIRMTTRSMFDRMFDQKNTVKRWSVDGCVDNEELVLDLGGGSDDDIWKKLIAKPIMPKLERPRLKQMPRTDKKKAVDLDVASFKRVQSAVKGHGADDHILKLCQSRYLDEEDWENLSRARKHAQSHSPEPKAPSHPHPHPHIQSLDHAQPHPQPHSHEERRMSGFKDLAARTSLLGEHFSSHEKAISQEQHHHHLKDDVDLVIGANRIMRLLRKQESHKALERFEEAVSDLPEAVSRQVDFQERVDTIKESIAEVLHESEVSDGKFESRQALLQTSSFALMSSGLLQKTEEGREKKTRPTRAEIQRRRARILQGIAPLRMGGDNLFAVLYRFGITNRAIVERTHRYLKSTQIAKPAKDDGIPFEIFYRLMRALQGPKSKHNESRAQLEEAMISNWFDSDVVCNLLFVAITNAPESFALGSQQLGPRRGFRLTVADILSSLRLLVCQTLILEVEARPRAKTGSDLNPNLPGMEGYIENEQGGLSAHGLSMLADCLHQGFTRQGAARNPQKSGTTDEGSFHRFMGEFPVVFGCLLRLLLPLVYQGRSFLKEDMELTRKHQDHRTGELQARMNRRIYREQAMLLERLWNEFTQPVLQKRRRLNAEHAKNWKHTDKWRSQVANVMHMGKMLRGD
eukprot:gnl/MRDRNA2_/MRDRNA2_97699_c0_seq1.p1 gnl/MRDRNA2_/MRDRNA2_97699_c0~~gnl/MRDRNA2_/MRDRNA2_97699_c0_seq1.p1  ORF type:complete len:935 (+),score=155.31 gnl/MRDRNA2_/MRDRNA2_97699_c0_seq1:206-3010(+)